MISQLLTEGNAIYGVRKLGELYSEFTCKSVFNSSRKFCSSPSIGGSYFGNIRKEAKLDKKNFRILTSIVCDSEAKLKGDLPLGKLFHFRAKDQEHYKTRAARYFNLVKYHLFDSDKKDKTHDYAWCFFPMYHAERDHLIIEELNAFVMWFKLAPKRKAEIVSLK